MKSLDLADFFRSSSGNFSVDDEPAIELAGVIEGILCVWVYRFHRFKLVAAQQVSGEWHVDGENSASCNCGHTSVGTISMFQAGIAWAALPENEDYLKSSIYVHKKQTNTVHGAQTKKRRQRSSIGVARF